tara:strand:- start:432 stop:1136 length:705 start_codon:yes stop_codon:yes gene_type:complete
MAFIKHSRMSKFQTPLTSADVRNICLENGLEISDSKWQLLEKWSCLLLEANKKINLISRKETPFLWEKQILPCLSLLIYRKFNENIDVCDFGSGGGLPGLVLAIIRSDLKLTLLDSRSKKVKVVQEIINELKLKNAQTLDGRGELLGKMYPWHQRFPSLTARAVAPLIDLVNWTSGLRKEESTIHIFKGGKIKEEISYLLKQDCKFRINKSLIVLKGYSRLAEDQKYIISLEFK